MEERVGLWWHQLVSRLAVQRYPDAAVTLASISGELGILFRALGGAHGVGLDAGTTQRNRSNRSLLERLAGAATQTDHSWMDDQALRLPEVLAIYPDTALNRDLYHWLSALGAVSAAPFDNWLLANQSACIEIVQKFTGLAATYKRLVQAELKRRGPLDAMPQDIRNAEAALRQALLHPGSVVRLPASRKPPHPVPLWLSPLLNRPVQDADASEPENQASGRTVQQDKKRRQAQDAGGPPRQGGILIFRPESIFSWTDYARVEHEIQENDDDDLARAADDMQAVSVTRDNSAVSKKLQMKLDRGEVADSQGSAPETWSRVPEWDYRRGVLLQDHCAIREVSLPDVVACEMPARLHAQQRRLQRQFSAVVTERKIQRNQPDGTDIDLDACIRQRTSPHSGEQNIYQSTRPRTRDLACLLLADFSLSTDAALDGDLRVIDVLRDSLLLFSETMSMRRDRLAVLGFSSRKRHDVRISEFKGFDEAYGGQVRKRILDAKPGDYTRMGAAIRIASQRLAREQSRDRLLLLLTDGKPNDADYYDGRYGIEDTRHALQEARKSGLTTFCVTIDQEAESYLPHIFGKHGFTIVTRPRELPQQLTQLYAQLTRSGAR